MIDIKNFFESHMNGFTDSHLLNKKGIPKILDEIIKNREELMETGNIDTMIYSPAKRQFIDIEQTKWKDKKYEPLNKSSVGYKEYPKGSEFDLLSNSWKESNAEVYLLEWDSKNRKLFEISIPVLNENHSYDRSVTYQLFNRNGKRIYAGSNYIQAIRYWNEKHRKRI